MATRFFRPTADDPLRTVERVHRERNVAERWSTALADKGWTSISNQFLECYSRLSPSITHGEAMFIVHLMQYKWDQSAPFPSLVTIAKRMGISTTSARSLARSLEKKGYLRREGQKGRTNRYHLKRLFEALEAFVEEPQSTIASSTSPLSDVVEY